MKKLKNIAVVTIVVPACLMCSCNTQKEEVPATPQVSGTFYFTVFKAGQADAISNIYYDTPDDYLIPTSLSKPKYKEKLRLRSYGIKSLPLHKGGFFISVI